MAVWSGFHPCTALAADVGGYGRSDDRRQSEIHHDLPRLMSRAAVGAGLDRSQWHIQPKGDEELAVYPMDGSEPRLVDDFVRHLAWELREYNAARVPALRMRLRLAVDHGPVELAANGFAGGTVVAVSRLLGSEHLYEALRVHERADLAVLLSDHVYRSTVGSGHTTLTAADFREVDVRIKEYAAAAWLRVPGYEQASAGRSPESREQDTDTDAADPDTDAADPEENRKGAGTAGHLYRAARMNVNHFAGPVDLRGGVVGFGDSRD
ncbi:hypothetical protein SAMN05216251_102540 [Actinacidiphila alni]|uniref:Uncharacterized protein n=1 Tax=Actinacidiphila alni TaxID=380248 RepID=A0A1I1ZQB1_9ACTN|nr:hypothetical protein [Actinacidiphila alni]SFE33907.1 hypothetical protein SAMN05216251_102540 [Actinacidiphila alni]